MLAEYARRVTSAWQRRGIVTEVCLDTPSMNSHSAHPYDPAAPPAASPGGASAAGGPRSADAAAFAAGALAAALGIAVSELVAGLLIGAPSLVIAIGDVVIENQPPGAKELMVALFGSNNKLALNVAIVLAALLIAGVLGWAGRRRWAIPVAGFTVAGAVGLVAALVDPLNDPLLALATVSVSIAAALAALRAMLRATRPSWASPSPGGPQAPPYTGPDADRPAMPDWDRRRFLQLGGGVAVGSLVMGVLGRTLLDHRPGGAPAGAQLAGSPVIADLPAGASLDVEGISPIVTPNDAFYRIDTALLTPRVDAATWQLAVKGLVDRELRLSFQELAEMPQFEQYVTIACVSNEVGGRLIGNALWGGVDLRQVLDMAGVQPDATQLVGRSVDGFTAGFPTAWAMDPERRPMIALRMNGEALPLDHGYPARLIIPGLYGYVSATKWLSEIELTTWEAFDGYWIPRGWAKEAPILTQSRIDVPRDRSRVEAGATVALAGVAWAPDRGVQAVEVVVDDGDWQPAQLSTPLNDATWVQWTLPWEAQGTGDHTIRVRATDGTGAVQTDERTPPAPDGARGHHSIVVEVV
jgi:DMSO/TMAO reductase YedYZ molybdopterin-dependent catalytic subunit